MMNSSVPIRRKITTLIAACTLSLISLLSASASDTASKAEGQGPGTAGSGETGTPVYGGGQGCSFAYSIQKIGPTYAEHDEEITYEVIVKNIGTCRLRHIEVADFLPHGLEFQAAYPEPKSVHNGRIEWEHLDLKAGRYQHFAIKARAKGHHPRWETNQVCAYTPWVGTRICDSESTWIYHHRDN